MINVYQLKYFYDACRLGSLTLSAKHNSLSHPAVSRAIRALEDNLNVPLLMHKKKHFELTQQGKFLFDRCEDLFLFLNEMRNGLSAQEDIVTGKVILGISRTVAQALLPEILKQLSAAHPKLEVIVRLGTTREISELLAARSIDVGISIGDEIENDFSGFTLKKGKFKIVKPKSSVKTRSVFFVTEMRPEVSALKSALKRFPGNIEFGSLCQIESWDLISRLVSEGLGFGMVPDLILRGEYKTKLREVRLRGFNYDYAIRVTFRSTRSRAVESFLTAIKN